MAYCNDCGTKLAEGAKFCHNCGETVDDYTASDRKTVYDGEIHKCPNCGAILDAYEFVCETCGYERRGAKAPGSVHELQIKLAELYARRPQRKSYTIFSQMWGGVQISNIDEEIVNLIKNFSIPNTKEDIMEFIILASSNIDIKVYGTVEGQRYEMANPAQREISDAWLAKFEQAYQKAQLMFGNSQEFMNIHLLFEKKQKEIRKKKWQLPILGIGVFGSVFLMFGFIFLILALTGSL